MSVGQIIGGEFDRLVMRWKSNAPLELGQLVVTQQDNRLFLLQVYDLLYGSQISQLNRELIAGMSLEQGVSPDFMDPSLRNYPLALVKNILTVSTTGGKVSKSLPVFFSQTRQAQAEDFRFLHQPKQALSLGKLRSGSQTLDVGVDLDGELVLSHHVLVTGTTGRGKSNLLRTLLWEATGKGYCGMLVLDPHDEYYGKTSGLKDHPQGVVYYASRDPPPGARSLKINLSLIRPAHLDGVAEFSDAQKQAVYLYAKEYGNEWIESVILEKQLSSTSFFREDTLAVVRRRLLQLLDLSFVNNQLFCNGIFDLQAGSTTIKDIVADLDGGKTVIINTSTFPGSAELLVGSLVAHELLAHRKRAKLQNDLDTRPVISLVLEEAPRVLGKAVVERGPNIFSTIAREGRKFRVGLVAITQLPSLIPRDILANMNTKIILGTEMKPERVALIDSAAHDLTDYDRAIASLDRGEALVTSNFAPFVLPVSIPLFSVSPTKKSSFSAPEL